MLARMMIWLLGSSSCTMRCSACVIAFGLPRQIEVGIEVAEGHQQAGALQAGDGGVRYRLLEAKGGLELGDRCAELLGAIEREPVEGVPLGGLLRMAGDGGFELLQQGERLIRRFGIRGEGDLLQAEVEQAQGLLLGTGQPAGTGVVEQGLRIAPQRGWAGALA